MSLKLLRNYIYLVFISYFLVGCTAVFNSSDSSIKVESLELVADCAQKAPVNLNYNCEPRADYTPGPSGLSMLSLLPNFELINNTCTGLTINSNTGVISGIKNMLEISSQCSYQVKVTQGNKTQTSEVFNINGSAAITYRFNKSNLAVQKGGSGQLVSVELSEPLPFKANIEYELYTNGEVASPFLDFNLKDVIIVSKGSSTIDFNFSISSSSGFLGVGDYGLTINNLKSEQGNNLLNVSAYQQSHNFDTLSSGAYHSCGIKNGELYCWGIDNDGVLGNGSASTGIVKTPEKIGSFSNWSSVSSGYYHTCGILGAGELYCWGSDSYGELGNGLATGVVESPQKIGGSSSWESVSAGQYQTCGINNGELFCWGNDAFGQLGNGSISTGSIDTPEKIGTSSDWSVISAGVYHTCGIDNGELFCWGGDGYGQLGNGLPSANVESPQKIGSSNTWTHVALGYYHTCGIDNGELYCWGRDNYGQVGNGSVSTGDIISPQRIGSSNTWTHVVLGYYHTCGIDNGELYCWGWNNNGQLGSGYTLTSNQDSPLRIGNSNAWTLVTAGFFHTCGLDDSLSFCWGSGSGTGIGLASKYQIETPEAVGTSNSWDVISPGRDYTCGINSGELYCWGKDENGQLGNGSEFNGNIEVPQKIGLSNTWSAISTGWHSCGINSGELYCWGDDFFGQLGNGSELTNDIEAPQRIGSSSDWSAIATSPHHTCGIDAGQLFCWGGDFNGQLGNGPASTAEVHEPQKIGSSSTWEAIAASGGFTCGIDAGQLFCWGSDYAGLMGNGPGSTADIDEPQRIGSSSTWEAIALGGNHACGIDAGKLYCWGEDDSEQTGNGPGTADVDEPQRIGSSSTWEAIALGGFHTCGIDAGELYCWGWDLSGQLGNGPGSTVDIDEPQRIGSSNTWQSISLGNQHTCGINNGRLYCFGSNSNSEIKFNNILRVPTMVVE